MGFNLQRPADIQPIAEPFLLDKQIRTDKIQFAGDGHDPVGIVEIEARSQIVAEFLEQPLHFADIDRAERGDGIDSVMEEMRLDLGLQPGRLQTQPFFDRHFQCG
ncbi:hypothetical protein D3C76_681160 [compost metagenome]